MPSANFDQTLLDQAFNRNTSAEEIDDLIFRRIESIAEIVAEAIESSSVELWVIEQLLGFRESAPPGAARIGSTRIVTVDFGRLLTTLAAAPEDMYKLPPRRFEELLAHIFERLGYDVSLTPESRDGGYDISAIRKAETESRVLIECKRYTPPNKVGRPVFQRLMGVLSDRDVGATMGLVATTSTFTTDAKAYIQSNRWKVGGHDFNGIVDLINRAAEKQVSVRPRPDAYTTPNFEGFLRLKVHFRSTATISTLSQSRASVTDDGNRPAQGAKIADCPARSR